MSADFLQSLLEHFATLEADLNKLDAATGDGDHGTTMLKGLRAAAVADEKPGKAFRRAAGGASGSLFGLLVTAFDETLQGKASLPEALATSAEKIHTLGQAVAGDKTMLDALLPAAAAITVADAAIAARKGCKATKDMSAKRGRAKYVEGAGVGHMDAGATSVAEILEIFAQHHVSMGRE